MKVSTRYLRLRARNHQEARQAAQRNKLVSEGGYKVSSATQVGGTDSRRFVVRIDKFEA